MPTQPNDYDNMLKDLQWQTFAYFLNETNPVNGLVADKTRSEWPASIAATGLALSSYPIGVERGFLSRVQAIKTTLATLRFFIRVSRVRIPKQPDTKVSTITFSIWKMGAGPGSRNYQL